MVVADSEIRRVLSTVSDPETGAPILNLGLVDEIAWQDDEASITFHPPSPYTPLTLVVKLALDMRTALAEVQGMRRVHVRVTRYPLSEYLNTSLAQVG